MLRPPTHRRRAAVALESAYAHLAFITVIILLVVAGYGSLRYQTVSWMACEAARYVSVHGSKYAKETDNASPTTQQVLDEVVLPLAVNMDAGKLTVEIAFIDMASGQATPWDSSSRAPTSSVGSSAQPQPVTNHIRVTVSYQWFPEMFFAGPVVLSSVAEIPMAY